MLLVAHNLFIYDISIWMFTNLGYVWYMNVAEKVFGIVEFLLLVGDRCFKLEHFI